MRELRLLFVDGKNVSRDIKCFLVNLGNRMSIKLLEMTQSATTKQKMSKTVKLIFHISFLTYNINLNQIKTTSHSMFISNTAKDQ